MAVGNKAKIAPALWIRRLSPFYDLVLKATIPSVKLLDQARKVTSLTQENALVLDLGCGTGWLTDGLASTFPKKQFIGIDADPQLLGVAEKRGTKKNVSFRLMNFLEGSPDLDGRTDLVFLSFVLHQVPTDEKKFLYVNAAARYLKPDGVLVVVDFVPDVSFRANLFRTVVSSIPLFRSAKALFRNGFLMYAYSLELHLVGKPVYFQSMYGKFALIAFRRK